LATHFPEAIALKQHTAQEVAQVLISVFTRFGFPCELISDQVSDFMSALMQIFTHEFHIDHIRTSAWHPETNGACERFNGSMKSMLRALSEKFSEAWDLALP
jgi:transposase InsO family protein